MSATIAKLVIKRTSVATIVPPLELLEFGELAINFTDGKLYYRNSSDVIETIGIHNPASLSENQTFSGSNIFSSPSAFNGIVDFNSKATFNSVAMNHINLTDGAIQWDAEDGHIASITLTENSTLNEISNISTGTYILRVSQDGVGSRSFTLGSNFQTTDGLPIEISTAPNSVSILTFLYIDGANIYVIGSNFS